MSKNSTLAELTELYVEGRLSDSQARELLSALRESPEAVSVVRNVLTMDYHLREACHPEVYQDSLRRSVEEQLRAISGADAFVASTLDRIEQVRGRATPASAPRPRRFTRVLRWTVPPVAAAAAVLIGLMHVGVIGPRPKGGVVAEAGAVSGADVEIRKADTERWRPIAADDAVVPGDAVRTGPDCEFELRYEDGTTVVLREGSQLMLRPSTTADLSTPPSSRQSANRAVPGKHVSLERGAIAASVTRQPRRAPMVIETAHGRFTVRGTAFWLMLADGGRPFTRLDVENGRVACRASGVEGEALRIGKGRATSIGPGIEPKVIKSDGREFSPEYGGCFFREYAELYETKGYALDVLPGEDGRELARVPVEKVAEAARASKGAHVELAMEDGQRHAIIRNDGDEAIWVTVPVPLPDVDSCRLACSIRLIRTRKSRDGFFVWGPRGDNIMDPEPRPPTTRSGKRGGSGIKLGRRFPYRLEFLHVGRTPNGRGVYERREMSNKTLGAERAWELLEDGADYPFSLRVPPGGTASVDDIRVLERVVGEGG